LTASRRFILWTRALQASALAVAVFFSMGASTGNARYTNLNHRLMCTCGCNELLGECNHTSCPMSGPELAELNLGITSGKSDREILSSFAVKYGATVLAAPTTKGFDLVAWIAPFAVFLAAMLGTILLVRRWSVGKQETLANTPVSEELREQIRRETGGDGGY